MLKVIAVAFAALVLAQPAEAATVKVEIGFSGKVETWHCANLGCLTTGVGDTPTTEPGAPPVVGTSDFSATLRFTMPEAALQLRHFSSPDAADPWDEYGSRGLAFSGPAVVTFLMHGHRAFFHTHVTFQMNELWPAYDLRNWQTFRFAATSIAPTSYLSLSIIGERSIPYVDPLPPHSGAPVVQQSYSAIDGYGWIGTDTYDLRFETDRFDLRSYIDPVAPVPLPASGVLLALGLGALVLRGRGAGRKP